MIVLCPRVLFHLCLRCFHNSLLIILHVFILFSNNGSQTVFTTPTQLFVQLSIPFHQHKEFSLNDADNVFVFFIVFYLCFETPFRWLKKGCQELAGYLFLVGDIYCDNLTIYATHQKWSYTKTLNHYANHRFIFIFIFRLKRF